MVYTRAAMARTMKVQEVILRAISKQLHCPNGFFRSCHSTRIWSKVSPILLGCPGSISSLLT
jgi:hypothetical protein